MLGKVDFGRVEAVERVKGDVFCVTLGNVLPDGERDGGGEGTTRSSGAAGNTKGAKGKSGGKRSPQTSDSAVRQSGGGGEKLWFIGTTGEVIPHDRVDWATFLSSDDEPGSWLQYVKTKDGTPAPGRPGGLTGPGKGMVAELVERVVLANCALNRSVRRDVSLVKRIRGRADYAAFLGIKSVHFRWTRNFWDSPRRILRQRWSSTSLSK